MEIYLLSLGQLAALFFQRMKAIAKPPHRVIVYNFTHLKMQLKFSAIRGVAGELSALYAKCGPQTLLMPILETDTKKNTNK